MGRMSKDMKKYLKWTAIILVVAGAIGLLMWQNSQPPYIPPSTDSPETNSEADVTFLQYGCYTCPYTQQFNLNTVPELREDYGEDVNFRQKIMPIRSNQGSALAGEAALCAEDQDMFWEYSDALFELRRSRFTQDVLVDEAENVGLDTEVFTQCLESGKYGETINQYEAEGQQANIGVTPTVFLKDEADNRTVRLDGALPTRNYRQYISQMTS